MTIVNFSVFEYSSGRKYMHLSCVLLLHFVVVVVAFPYTVESHKEKKKDVTMFSGRQMELEISI